MFKFLVFLLVIGVAIAGVIYKEKDYYPHYEYVQPVKVVTYPVQTVKVVSVPQKYVVSHDYSCDYDC
ncbi:hypothetical protein X975_01097, partial [Stegodyphus mimosarum]